MRAKHVKLLTHTAAVGRWWGGGAVAVRWRWRGGGMAVGWRCTVARCGQGMSLWKEVRLQTHGAERALELGERTREIPAQAAQGLG